MKIERMPANKETVVLICDEIARAVAAVMPESWHPKVLFNVADNPVNQVLLGKYEFRLTCEVPEKTLQTND